MVKGTLVRVATGFDYRRGDIEESMLDKHGALWITTSPVLPDGFIWCRSLATGFDFDWHQHDLTTHEEANQTKEGEPTTC